MKQIIPVGCALVFALIACEAKKSSDTNPPRQPNGQADSTEGNDGTDSADGPSTGGSDGDGSKDPRNKPTTDGGGTTDGSGVDDGGGDTSDDGGGDTSDTSDDGDGTVSDGFIIDLPVKHQGRWKNISRSGNYDVERAIEFTAPCTFRDQITAAQVRVLDVTYTCKSKPEGEDVFEKFSVKKIDHQFMDRYYSLGETLNCRSKILEGSVESLTLSCNPFGSSAFPENFENSTTFVFVAN